MNSKKRMRKRMQLVLYCSLSTLPAVCDAECDNSSRRPRNRPAMVPSIGFTPTTAATTCAVKGEAYGEQQAVALKLAGSSRSVTDFEQQQQQQLLFVRANYKNKTVASAGGKSVPSCSVRVRSSRQR